VGETAENRTYLHTKTSRMGHMPESTATNQESREDTHAG
jgi:hypothetical protein